MLAICAGNTMHSVMTRQEISDPSDVQPADWVR